MTWELLAKVCDMVQADAHACAERSEAELAAEAAGKLPWWIRRERRAEGQTLTEPY